MVSLMTALWFSELRAEDRVSVKPHASPVLHAINYLLGRLEQPYLESLRAFGGLQSYPSRTKDPDPVDYSTGSVGIGATAPIWGAIARRYLEHHRFEAPPSGRQIALLGDAELDEGAVWEAIADPWVARLGEVLWVVDLNRQSLDRVVPDIAFGRLAGMFEAAGWQVITVKYGRRLEALFERAGRRRDLRRRIDEMPNEEYQRLLRAEPAELRERLPGRSAGARRRWSGELGDDELRAALPRPRRPRPRQADRGLPGGRARPPDGGLRLHDQGLVAARSRATRRTTRRCSPPSSSRSSPASSAPTPSDPWAPFDPGSPEGELARSRGHRARARGARAAQAAGGAGHARPQAPRAGVDPAGLRPLLRRPRARGARGGRAGGHGEPGRGQLDQPRRLDQQVGDLVGGRAARLVRRRPADARALARDHRAAATSSSASPRRTWSACSASWAPPGAATASRCSRSGRSTTRSWAARSSRGRSASTRAASRS